jgi:hypothetical protein
MAWLADVYITEEGLTTHCRVEERHDMTYVRCIIFLLSAQACNEVLIDD